MMVLTATGCTADKSTTPQAATPIQNAAPTPSRAPRVPAVGSLTAVSNADGTNTFPVQYNNLWGHEFYTAKIDQSSSIDIGSEPKQIIGRLLDTLAFPPSLTKHLIILNVDPTVTKTGDKLVIPWQGNNPIPATIQPKGGTAMGIGGDGAIISLNNLVGYDRAVLTHELGHVIGSHLTDAEWTRYYKLRAIPSGTPRTASDWSLSPSEDFAEVYKAVNKATVSGTDFNEDWMIRTRYGLFLPASVGGEFGSSCWSIYYPIQQKLLDAYRQTPSGQGEIFPPQDVLEKVEAQASADPKLQDCRKKSNEQALLGGPMYVSSVDQATTQFVNGVVERLRAADSTAGSAEIRIPP